MALLALALVAAACNSGDSGTDSLPPRPQVPDGPLDPTLEANIDEVFTDPTFLTAGDLPALGASGDVRVAWPLVDLARFHESPDTSFRVIEPLEELTGIEPAEDEIPWVVFSDALLAWDVPAPERYLDWKREVFLASDPSWEPFFDETAELDWRQVTWGGIFRDGIEALSDAPTMPGADAAYLDDGETVFGVVVEGEARAYPRRHMAVHELANDTVGGRRVTLPFCTLCGSVIGYFADEPPEGFDTFEMRTSGLLLRSNKLMYDVGTESLFHQFFGNAVTGPLFDEGSELTQFPVVTTTWGRWLEDHPDTTVLVEDAGTGRDYEAGFLGRGEDEEDPVFPVGEVDDRLPPKTRVFGVETPEGAAVAFVFEEAVDLLEAGEDVGTFGVELRLDAGGLAASMAGGGPELVGHEAFWFAWSQFRPDTKLWAGD